MTIHKEFKASTILGAFYSAEAYGKKNELDIKGFTSTHDVEHGVFVVVVAFEGE